MPWNAKAACTFAVKWLFFQEGVLEEAEAYAPWPHQYRPGFPSRFGSIEDARAFCRSFFSWYNEQHRHGGIGLLTPQMVPRDGPSRP